MTAAKHGWILEWLLKDEEDSVDCADNEGLTVEQLQARNCSQPLLSTNVMASP
jgi:hypothetical protein